MMIRLARRLTGVLPLDLLRRNPQRRHPLGWCIDDCDEIKMGWCALYLAVKEELRPEQAQEKLHGRPAPMPTNDDLDDCRKMREQGALWCDLAEMYCMRTDTIRALVKARNNYLCCLEWRKQNKAKYAASQDAYKQRRKEKRQQEESK